jgi:valyl-tRNA synthetase
VQALYHLTFDDFCDWYAESVKPRLYDGDEDARATALAALERLLKLPTR